MRKSVLLVAILVAFVGVSVEAQETVRSKYGDSFLGSVANRGSNLTGKTLLEKRDYGIDLFIAGMVLNAVAPWVIGFGGSAISIGAAVGTATSGNAAVAVVGGAVGVFAAGSIAAATFGIGFAMWIAGAVYWGEGNAALRLGSVAVGTQEHGTDILIAFDGTGMTLRY